MKKQIVTVLLAAMTAASLAGCGSTESASPSASTAESTVSDASTEDSQNATEDAAAQTTEDEEYEEGSYQPPFQMGVYF